MVVAQRSWRARTASAMAGFVSPGVAAGMIGGLVGSMA